MKTLFEYVWKFEMLLIGLGAIACYGRYNYYKGRISKDMERGEKRIVIDVIEDSN